MVDHAEYVVTSSFHGAAFSIIFQKKFSVIVNPKLPSRIDNLMNTLKIPAVEICQLSEASDFLYDRVKIRIDDEKEKSMEYLREALK